MQRGIIVSLVLFIIFASMPVVVNVAEEQLNGASQQGHVGSPTTPSSSSMTVPRTAGVYYSGTATAGGSDVLYVTPADVHVSEAGTIITVNVTVKFRHAQPCRYPDWRIDAKGSGGVSIVEETKTVLKDPYTAFKQYTANVTGNGTLTVTYHYGSGCPYGSEESAVVRIYLTHEVGQNGSTVVTSSSSSTQNGSVITGTLEEVSTTGHYLRVNGITVYVRGRWWMGDEYVTWRKVIESLKAGEKVTVKATRENGELMATEIRVDNTAYRRG